MKTSLSKKFYFSKKLYLFNAILLLTIISIGAYAAVYKKIDENGNVTYSDAPTASDQKPHDIGQPMVYESKPIPAVTSSVAEPKTEDAVKTETKYQSLTISSPEDDQSLRENAGNVSVSYSSQPALDTKANHQYILYLDGKEVSTSQNSHLILPNTDRGTHTLDVEIVNKEQETLIKSDTITFHLQRVSIRPRAR